MNKLLQFFLLLAISGQTYAQQDATASDYNKIQTLPNFIIRKVPDCTAFTNEALRKNEPVVIIFFSPDCDHCQRETKELLAYKKELEGIQIVMASPAAYTMVKDFYKDYNIASMPGITMGYDPEHRFSMRFPLRTYPGIFVYDARGQLAKAFVGNAGVPAILDALK